LQTGAHLLEGTAQLTHLIYTFYLEGVIEVALRNATGFEG
jgi:hypothetical protein